MSSTAQILAAFAAGMLLGVAYFLGLWATIRHLGRSRHPALWMLASLLLRMAVLLAGFGLLARFGGWQAVLAGLAGVLGVRFYLQGRLAAPPHDDAQRVSR